MMLNRKSRSLFSASEHVITDSGVTFIQSLRLAVLLFGTLLQSCTKYETQSLKYWPTENTQEANLYGSIQKLQKNGPRDRTTDIDNKYV